MILFAGSMHFGVEWCICRKDCDQGLSFQVVTHELKEVMPRKRAIASELQAAEGGTALRKRG